jgi:protoheme ferro-lyase
VPLYLDISVALVVFMGLASGGILSLVLMSERRQQANFAIMLGLSLLLALGGGAGMIAVLPNVASSLTNVLILLVLSLALGYTLTSFSALSPRRKKWAVEVPGDNADRTAVVLLMPGEPPDYSVWSAARRLELADDPKDVPPILLRPFYMRDLKHKYAAIRTSPYRQYQHRLADEIRARLESGYRVYEAYYSDHPTLAEAAATAIEEGARRIILAHIRVTDPPDPVMQGELLEGLDLDNLGVKVTQVGPMWVSSLLPQIYVRRIIEAIPQAGNAPDDVGLLLVGRGHSSEGESAQARQEQEASFQRKVRQALMRVGFGEDRVVIGWVRGSPNCAEALQTLVEAGCKSVYVIPSAFVADGITTLFDIPAQVQALAAERGVKLSYLPAWNADGLAAEEIAVYVRAVSAAPLPQGAGV